MTERIPLFPLEVVLFPGATLPLHIFEPRYKEMIRLCLGEEREFGVVLQRPQGIVATGCTALVAELLKEYEDGRLDILALGQRRFHVAQVIEEKSYYEADITFLDEPAPQERPAPPALVADYERIHDLLFHQPPPPLDADEVPSVAWAMAGELPLSLDFQQALLEAHGEELRRELLHRRLAEWIPQVAHQKRVKRVAGGNGHGLRGKGPS